MDSISIRTLCTINIIVHTDHTTLLTYSVVLSLVKKVIFEECVCICVCLFVYGCYNAGAHSSEQERLHLSSPPITHWEHLRCVCTCVHTITLFFFFYNLCVRLFDCAHRLCVCVCLRKALGLQAAWWQCRWDNIWHVSDWVSVCMHVCVRISPSGLPSDRPGLPLLSVAHWGAGGTTETERSEACLPPPSCLTSTNSFYKTLWCSLLVHRSIL